MPVIVAFNAGSLLPVAQTYRGLYLGYAAVPFIVTFVLAYYQEGQRRRP